MTRLTLASILALLATTTSAAADARPPAEKLEGTWSWSSGADGTLEAIFTSTGAERWNVDFHFEFDGRPRTYSGTAEGSLVEGPLRGTVENENGRRTFTFEGSFRDGELRGTHAELKRGRGYATGTLTLRNPSAD